MERLDKIELCPRRWRLGVAVVLCFALNSVLSTLQDSGSIKLMFVQLALVLIFAFGGWFIIPFLARFVSMPTPLGVALLLLPVMILAGVNLLLMSTIAEGPIILYLVAPILRISQPERGELLPKKVMEWGVFLLLFGFVFAYSFFPWTDIAAWIVQRMLLHSM